MWCYLNMKLCFLLTIKRLLSFQYEAGSLIGSWCCNEKPALIKSCCFSYLQLPMKQAVCDVLYVPAVDLIIERYRRCDYLGEICCSSVENCILPTIKSYCSSIYLTFNICITYILVSCIRAKQMCGGYIKLLMMQMC